MHQRSADENYIEEAEKLRKAGIFPAWSASEEGQVLSSSGWYIVFEKDSSAAVEKAIRLAKEKAVEKHCAQINDFLNKCELKSGDSRFDQAVGNKRPRF